MSTIPPNLGLVLLSLVFVFGPCIVLAGISFASIRVLGRNPSTAPKVFSQMIIPMVAVMAISMAGIMFFLKYVA